MQAQLVKKLRDLTGSPIIHCKKALEECKNDLVQAQEWLRLKGISQAHKKLQNQTGAGLVSGTLTDKAGYLIEVLCETDFVAKTDLFQKFTRDSLVGWSQSAVGFDQINTIKLPSFSSTIEEAKLHTISKTQENVIIRRGVKYEFGSNAIIGLYLHNTVDSLLGLSGCLVKIKSAEPVGDHLDKVKAFAYQLSMQVVAGKPIFLKKDQIPADFIAKERTAIEQQLDEKTKSKSKEVLENIIKSKVEKSLDSVTLLEQVFMISEDPEEKLVKRVLQDVSKEISNQLEIEAYSIFGCENIN